MYSSNPVAEHEYNAIGEYAERILKGETGDDPEKALKVVESIARQLRLDIALVRGIIASVRDKVKGIQEPDLVPHISLPQS